MHSERAQQCEPGYEDVKSLAKPSATSPLYARTASRRAVQFLCLFFALPQRIGEEKALRGLIPLRTPEREKVAALRFAHLFAKFYIFNFCECDLKKVALTKVARTPLSQKMIVTASFPVIDKISNRTRKQQLLPCEPILGVRLCAQDGGGLRSFAFPPFFVRTADGKGGPGRNGRVSFLATSWETPRSSISTKRAALWRALPVGEVVKNSPSLLQNQKISAIIYDEKICIGICAAKK